MHASVPVPYTGGPSGVCPRSARDRGVEGERRAREYLVSRGYRILDENFRTRRGEIDIVASNGREVVFVEVKSAGSVSFGDPLCWVPRWKQERIALASAVYLSRKRMDDTPVRFDVIAVGPSGAVRHVQDAFRPQSPQFRL